MKVFSVYNPKRSANAAWVLAKDKDRALEIAKKYLSSKTLATRDETAVFINEPGIPALIAAGKEGRLCKELSASVMSGTEFVNFLGTGKKPVKAPDQWRLF